MARTDLSRRQLLQVAALAPLALLHGCSPARSQLVVSRGDFAGAWGGKLPRSWALQILEEPLAVQSAIAEPGTGTVDLVQLWDGWASRLRPELLRPFGAAALLQRLDPAAAAASRLFRPVGSPALAFPWAVDAWVLLLRSRPDLERRRAEGWALLLDGSLHGKLVLPSSPRLSISLVGGDPQQLRQLRRSALACDERHGLSLLLSGEAEALVLPRRRALPLLRQDPRLAVVLPDQGAPLGWNLLLRPASAAPLPPHAWLEGPLAPPLLPRLLQAGWVPPLPRAALERAALALPPAQRALLLPPAEVQRRCWSLPPLSAGERRRLQALWDAAAPPPS